MIRLIICTVLFLFSLGFAKADAWTSIDFPDSRSTRIYGISGNNLTGEYTDAFGATHGFLYKDNNWTSFDGPQGTTFMLVTGIDGGTVVGSYSIGTWPSDRHGFIYEGSIWTSFDLPGAVGARAYMALMEVI
jgi:hypothetical protein